MITLTTPVTISAGQTYTLRATGTVLKFDGFTRVYADIVEPGGETAAKEERAVLPPLEAGMTLTLHAVVPEQHFTEPPPRFTEATLVKGLEENGIGRPSTYAPIMSTIQERGYVDRLDNRQLKPTELGFVVNDFLIEQQGGVLRVTINHPERGNGMTDSMAAELTRVVDGAAKSAKRICTPLYTSGAVEVARNWRYDWSTPVTRAERPMKIGLRSITRVSSTVSASCAGSLSKPGATNVGTSHGAASHMTAESPTSERMRTFITLDATCQASFSRSLAR